MRLLARWGVALGLGFLALGLLRLHEDSWIYAHVSGTFLLGVLGAMFLAACLLTGKGSR
jgi:hypothetical protein